MTLAIYCAGGLGREILELARKISRWQSIVFVDDISMEKFVNGSEVFRYEDIKYFEDDVEFIIACGEPSLREKLFRKVKGDGFRVTTLIHDHCSIYKGATLGEGCILWDCNISTDVKIGDNVLINTKSIVGHDTVIESNCVLSAYSFIGGFAKVCKCTYIAPGSMVKDRVTIGEDAIIGMGAVVLRNVNDNEIMIGNPAKKVGDNVEKRVFNLF